MALKRYIIAGMGFILISTLLFISIGFLEIKEVSVLGLTLAFPLVLWIVLPLIGLFLATIFHISYYSVSHFFKTNTEKKEFTLLIDAWRKGLLGESSSLTFKNSDLATLYRLLNCVTITPKKDGFVGITSLDEALTVVRKIESGEYVDGHKNHLSNTSELYFKNEKNRLFNDTKYAESYIKNYASDSKKIQEVALILVQKSDVKTWRKLDILPNREIVGVLISRMKEGFLISDVVNALQKGDFEGEDFIYFAKIAYKKLSPEEALTLFKEIGKNFKDAMNGELYLAIQYELSEKKQQLLQESTSQEMMLFKAYLLLRDAGIRVNLDDFLESLHNVH